MITEWLEKLVEAVQVRSPMFVDKLRPGLPEAKIRQTLKRAVKQEPEQLVELYHWKDGMTLDRELAASKNGVCPGRPYYFLSLEMAVGHLGHFEAAARTHPQIAEAVGRYFPVLWDGSNGWIAIDLAPSSLDRVVRIDLRSQQPFTEISNSFEAFIRSAIQSNQENKVLACFQTV